jgi:hypothetical protein
MGRRDRDDQHHGPQPEHHLDLAEEVQELGGDTRPGRRREWQPRGVTMLKGVRQPGEARRGERVQDGDHEDRRDDEIEGILRHARRERRQDAVGRRGRIGRQRGRKDRGVDCISRVCREPWRSRRVGARRRDGAIGQGVSAEQHEADPQRIRDEQVRELQPDRREHDDVEEAEGDLAQGDGRDDANSARVRRRPGSPRRAAQVPTMAAATTASTG